MAHRLLASFIGFFLVLAAVPLSAQQLRPGYVVCESGGQLRWFIDLKDLNELWKPHQVPWKLPVRLDGGTNFGPQARKALQAGWCKTSAELARSNVISTDSGSCDKDLPYPNGGCRRIRIGSAAWYTFGDALSTASANASVSRSAGSSIVGADPACLPLPKPSGSVRTMNPQRVKVSKFGSHRERPDEFRVFTQLTLPDGVPLKPPIVVKMSPSCFEVPVMEDAVWNPAKGTLTFWPDTKTPSECRAVCMGAK